MEANAPPAGSWNRRLRPPGPRVGARNLASLSPLPWHSRYTTELRILAKILRPRLTSALARGHRPDKAQRGSAIKRRRVLSYFPCSDRMYLDLTALEPLSTPVLEEVSQAHSQPSALSPIARRPSEGKSCVSAGRRRPKRVIHVPHAQILLTLSIFLSVS